VTKPGSPNSVVQKRPQRSGEPPDGDACDAATYLLRALGAESGEQKRHHAQLGLALLGGGPGIAGAPADDKDSDDNEFHALLLRQVYLADIEEGADRHALQVAEQMIHLGTLGDIARQDAARAALGLGDVDVAIGHLEIATRVCPVSRRAFHYGHLGSLLRFDGQIARAIEAFSNAMRWASEDRTLYRAQQALAEVATGTRHPDLNELRRALEHDETPKAYSLWILGELCLLLDDKESAANYLVQFLSRQAKVPRAKSLALGPEIAHAQALLKKMSA
jgi:tetratricopeptide (TPR) repeat protein